MNQPEHHAIRSVLRSALRWVGLWIAYLAVFTLGAGPFAPPIETSSLSEAEKAAGELGLLAMAAIVIAR